MYPKYKLIILNTLLPVVMSSYFKALNHLCGSCISSTVERRHRGKLLAIRQPRLWQDSKEAVAFLGHLL